MDSELELGMEIQIRDQFEVAIKIVELVEVARLEHRSPKTEPWGVAAVHEPKKPVHCGVRKGRGFRLGRRLRLA